MRVLMKLTYLLLAALLIFWAIEFSRTFLLLQRSRSLAKNSNSFQTKNPDARLKIIFLGDSTAVGTGAADPWDSVAGRFGKDYPGAYIVNLGKNGNRVKNLAEEFDPEAYRDFNLVVIQAGGNDILRFTPLKDLEKYLNALLGKAKQASEQVLVLHSGNIGLAPFFPRPFGWIWSYRTQQVREIYRKIAAAHGAVYVDLYAERKDDPFLKDIQKFYAPDFLHASGEGYGIWYEKIREAMQNSGIRL